MLALVETSYGFAPASSVLTSAYTGSTGLAGTIQGYGYGTQMDATQGAGSTGKNSYAESTNR